mmetsp:Transcript_16709/g.52216  ORF Transcript_16709/g.52216 Transcript_16709/m.52216 type:complete len:369 (-) Transcript_16709:996-2102(-)
MPGSPYNAKNTTIKRIMKEMAELRNDCCVDYAAWALDENIFEFHFTVRGPRDSPFEGGLYHGKILLPPEYPFKPPHFYFLTPSGRFEVGRKICLTISSYHPESWQPSWSIRTALIAIIGFFPTPAHGAIGSVDASDETRISLAAKSVDWSCPDCGSHNGTVLQEKAAALEAQGVKTQSALDLSDDVTAQMQLSAPPPTPPATPAASPAASPAPSSAKSSSRLREAATDSATDANAKANTNIDANANANTNVNVNANVKEEERAMTPAKPDPATPTKTPARPTAATTSVTTSSTSTASATASSGTPASPPAQPTAKGAVLSPTSAAPPASSKVPSARPADRSVLVLNVAIAAVVTAIVAIIAKKVIDGA